MNAEEKRVCERCHKGKVAFRVHSDLLDLFACASCAASATKLPGKGPGSLQIDRVTYKGDEEKIRC